MPGAEIQLIARAIENYFMVPGSFDRAHVAYREHLNVLNHAKTLDVHVGPAEADATHTAYRTG